MLHPAIMAQPCALRMRAVHPLVEGDGSCALLYDLERAAVVEVPEELHFHVAPALETGDLDEALVGWLVSEDLLTCEGRGDWGDFGASGPVEVSAWWRSGAIYRLDGELHARIEGAREEEALEIVEFVFRQSAGTSRVKLHLSWDGGAYPGDGLLQRIVLQASYLAGRLHQDLALQLTVAAAEMTAARADLLAGLAFQVRLLCGSYPAPLADHLARPAVWKAEPLVRQLLDRLGDRLTVHCVLEEGRLHDLWQWAKRMGVRHLDTTIAEDAVIGDGSARPERRREIRNDLLALYDEMADELAAQRVPIDYKPLTRLVDRLMRSEPRTCNERGSFSNLVPMAYAYPHPFPASFDLHPQAELRGGAGTQPRPAAMEIEPPCHGCWARYVCGHSSFVVSAQDGEETHEISEDACVLWRTEVEVALRFYHRLAHTDPLQVRRFFEDVSRKPALAPGLGEDPGLSRMPF